MSPAGIGLVAGERTLAAAHQADDARTDAWLDGAIEDCLAAAGADLADVEGFAVTIGPGAFTGIRVGIATALGLSAPRRLPVAGVQTVEALAEAARPAGSLVAPCIDARRGQVYGAVYELPEPPTLPLAPRLGPLAVDPAAFATLLGELLEPPLLVGSGAGPVADLLGVAPASLAEPAAAAAARLAARSWLVAGTNAPPTWPEAEPVYVRPPDAKPPRNRLLERR